MNTFYKVILLSLTLRLLNSITTWTFFQPDEYWQSLEISHSIVFDYGYRTWEWRALGLQGGIRSPLYPYVFVPIYSFLQWAQLDDTILLTLAPKLIQGCIASCCDVATWLLATKLLGARYANVALFCSLTSFFNAYALTRTFSNSTETTLTTIALALWPWDGLNPSSKVLKKGPDATSTNYPQLTSLTAALVLASLATIMRPSNAIIWIILGSYLFFTCGSSPSRYVIANTTLLIAILSISFCYYLDTSFYYHSTFTPFNFLVQNVYNSISLFYGQNPFHFYLTQALPVMTFLSIPFVLHGWYLSNGMKKIKIVKWVIGGTTLVYSFLGHKEFRFVHPLLPLLHILASYSLVHLNTPFSTSSTPIAATPTLSLKPFYFIFLSLNLLPAIYLNTYHSIGQISILSTLQTLPREELKTVAFLMPCHSTPWMSHLHRKDLMEGGRWSGEGGKAWFLTCEPPVLGQNPSTYQDQSDYFYQNPILYLSTRFPFAVDPTFPPSPFPRLYSKAPTYSQTKDLNDLGWNHTWPSHLVVFQDLLDTTSSTTTTSSTDSTTRTVKDLLEDKGYREEERLWNSHWHDDDRRRGDVVLLRWVGEV